MASMRPCLQYKGGEGAKDKKRGGREKKRKRRRGEKKR